MKSFIFFFSIASLLFISCSGTYNTPPPEIADQIDPPEPDEKPENFATEMLNAVNAARVANGVTTPLKWNANLEKAALDHTTWMNKTGQFSHTGEGGTTFIQRIEAAGYTGWTSAAENIAWGQTSVSQVMSTWMKSAGHRANILNAKTKEIGAARVGNYWTQDFGTRRITSMGETVEIPDENTLELGATEVAEGFIK